jgi:hypothetical protein
LFLLALCGSTVWAGCEEELAGLSQPTVRRGLFGSPARKKTLRERTLTLINDLSDVLEHPEWAPATERLGTYEVGSSALRGAFAGSARSADRPLTEAVLSTAQSQSQVLAYSDAYRSNLSAGMAPERAALRARIDTLPAELEGDLPSAGDLANAISYARRLLPNPALPAFFQEGLEDTLREADQGIPPAPALVSYVDRLRQLVRANRARRR